MVKSCRVKKRTIMGKKRKGFNGFKQRKIGVVNSNVNNAVNTVNIQENDKNYLVNKTNNSDDGERVDTSISEVNSSAVFERKVETIENSEPTFDERSITDNRIVDMELFAAVVHMLGCPFCRNTSIILQEDPEKKKGPAPLLTAKCTSCDFCTDFYNSRSYDNTFDIDTKAAAYSMRAIGQGYAGLETLTSLMNLPKPVTANNYDKLIYRLVKTTKAVADITMQDTCEELRVDSSSDSIKGVKVSSDGTWQHRGYSSLNVVVTVIP